MGNSVHLVEEIFSTNASSHMGVKVVSASGRRAQGSHLVGQRYWVSDVYGCWIGWEMEMESHGSKEEAHGQAHGGREKVHIWVICEWKMCLKEI